MNHLASCKVLIATCLIVTGVFNLSATYAADKEASAAIAPLPVSMNEHLVAVFAKQKQDQMEAFDTWQAQYVRDVTQIPGVAAARLYKQLELKRGMPPPPLAGAVPNGNTNASPGGTLAPSLLLYIAKNSTPAGLVGSDASGRTPLGDAVDPDSFVTSTMKPLGPVMWARDVAGTDPKPMGNGAVAEYLFMVFSDPAKPEWDAAYNFWYDHHHMQDVLRVPGSSSAQRFVTVDADSKLPQYLVIFTFRSGDLAASAGELTRRIQTGFSIGSPTLGRTQGGYFVAVGAPVLSNGAAGKR